MSDREDIERYVETLSPTTQRGMKIIGPHDVMGGKLLHISTNTNIKKFYPIIGLRQAHSEDRTVPRVCTTPTLLGCMLGYVSMLNDFHYNAPTGAKEDDYYKGGYKIYGFDFKHAIKPSKKLVYDQDISDEHWLVAYNKDSASYEPVSMGKVFVSSTINRATSTNTPHCEVEMYAEITHEEGIRFSKNQHLTKGYWKIIGPSTKDIGSWKDDSEYKFEQISKSDYFVMKDLSAGLLAYESPLPNFVKW